MPKGERQGTRPLRLALVETRAPPKARHRAAAGAWAVTRMAKVFRPPVNSGSSFARAGTIQVTGPGQLWVSRLR
jgi:hypothetical protein